MKIVFWGTPIYASENLQHIVNAGFEVIAVVTQPDRKRNRVIKLSPSPVKQAAINLGIPVYTTQSIRNDLSTRKLLFNLKADVYIVVAFGQILPKEILDEPKLGCWNSHASLLPLWRGAAPIQWSIINDDQKTGICIMAMEEGLDTGPVIEQESIDIKDSDNLEMLSNKLSEISSKLLVKSLKRINFTKGLDQSSRLKKLNAIDQSKLQDNPSYARQIKKEDYLIDWNQTSRKILKRILGLYPNSYTLHKGKRIKILEAIILDRIDIMKNNPSLDENLLNKAVPGEIIILNKRKGFGIMTNDFPILIKQGQLEGKNKTDGYTLSLQSKLFIHNIIGN